MHQCFPSGTLLEAYWHPAKLLKGLLHIQPCVCTWSHLGRSTMLSQRTAGGECVGVLSERDVKRELSVENLPCCFLCVGELGGAGGARAQRSSRVCRSCLMLKVIDRRLSHRVIRELLRRQTCFSKKLPARTSITSFCFPFTRSMALSFQPGRQDEMLVLYVSAKAQVSRR